MTNLYRRPVPCAGSTAQPPRVSLRRRNPALLSPLSTRALTASRSYANGHDHDRAGVSSAPGAGPILPPPAALPAAAIPAAPPPPPPLLVPRRRRHRHRRGARPRPRPPVSRAVRGSGRRDASTDRRRRKRRRRKRRRRRNRSPPGPRARRPPRFHPPPSPPPRGRDGPRARPRARCGAPLLRSLRGGGVEFARESVEGDDPLVPAGDDGAPRRGPAASPSAAVSTSASRHDWNRASDSASRASASSRRARRDALSSFAACASSVAAATRASASSSIPRGARSPPRDAHHALGRERGENYITRRAHDRAKRNATVCDRARRRARGRAGDGHVRRGDEGLRDNERECLYRKNTSLLLQISPHLTSFRASRLGAHRHWRPPVPLLHHPHPLTRSKRSL